MNGYAKFRRKRWKNYEATYSFRIFRINTDEEIPVRTGGGDDGKSSLFGGSRRPKDDIAFEALGAVDEAQVALGVCRSLLSSNPSTEAIQNNVGKSDLSRLTNDLVVIQNNLLLAGGALSLTPAEAIPEGMKLLDEKDVRDLEETFRYWREKTTIEPRFYIAGDSVVSAEFDRARTIVRRSERRVVRLIRERGVRIQIPVSAYLNILSDLCFVVARLTM